MMTEIELKRRLEEIGIKQYASPKLEVIEVLLPSMLHFIGSTDSQLRDGMIYRLMDNWIMDRNLISIQKCREILSVVLDENHLFYKLGEKDTDSVFTRSFSVLLLSPLLLVHRNTPYLAADEVIALKTKLLQLVIKEKDKRGYVQDKGWAHIVAHSADALDDLAQCNEMEQIDLQEILAALKIVILNDQLTYGYGEDERMVTPVTTILNRELISQEEFVKWINDLGKEVLSDQPIPEKTIKRMNTSNFLKSLYFRLKWNNVDREILLKIEQVLQKINPYYQSYNVG